MRRIRVTHVIPNLQRGGAEEVLLRLLARTDRTRFDSDVVLLGRPEDGASRARELDVEVTTLGMRPGGLRPSSLLALVGYLRRREPDVVQSWMYHANLLAAAGSRAARRPALVWGIHQTDLPPEGIGRSTRAVARLDARLAPHLPDRIVFCADASYRIHVAAGYPPERSVVIPNGFVVGPLPEDRRAAARRALELPPDAPVIGRIGRSHPQKDHRTFLEAAALVARRHPSLVVLMCGPGIDDRNPELRTWIGQLSLQGRVRLLGVRSDVPTIHESLDVAVSSSAFGEAQPLVLGEAMERAVPVVTTDVGDCRQLVGDGGVVVPPRDAPALAAAIDTILRRPVEARAALGLAGRARIRDRYDVATMVRQYEDVYASVPADRGPGSRPRDA